MGFGLGAAAYASYPYVYPYDYGYGYRRYGYRSYGYGYDPYLSGYGGSGYYGTSSYYGGYARTGHARLRILGAPEDAEVYVDGYYAGIVDDYDGVFQHLELDPGPHQIEIRVEGFAPIAFDMQAIDGRTTTYRVRLNPDRR